MPTLAERIQYLPAELFNEIYELTFTSNPNKVIIKRDFKPPAQLQVDRVSRKRFCREYYGSTTFVMRDNGIEWLLSLAPEAKAVLHTIMFVPDGLSIPNLRLIDYSNYRELRYFVYALDSRSKAFDHVQFSVAVTKRQEDGTFTKWLAEKGRISTI